MKWTLLPIIFILIISFANAIICTDYQQVNQTCTLTTASTICATYNYKIYNQTNDIQETGNLSYYGPTDIYYFNFSQPEGQYIIQTCDGSTRQITVGAQGDNNMIIGALILIPLLFAAILLYWMNSLSEEHNILKLLLGLLPIPLLWMSLQFASTAIIKLYGLSDLVNNISYFLRITGYLFFVLLAYFILYILIVVINNLAKNKQDKLEY